MLAYEFHEMKKKSYTEKILLGFYNITSCFRPIERHDGYLGFFPIKCAVFVYICDTMIAMWT